MIFVHVFLIFSQPIWSKWSTCSMLSQTIWLKWAHESLHNLNEQLEYATNFCRRCVTLTNHIVPHGSCFVLRVTHLISCIVNPIVIRHPEILILTNNDSRTHIKQTVFYWLWDHNQHGLISDDLSKDWQVNDDDDDDDRICYTNFKLFKNNNCNKANRNPQSLLHGDYHWPAVFYNNFDAESATNK